MCGRSGGSRSLLSFLGFILLNPLTYVVALTLVHETSPCGHLSYVGIGLPSQSPSVPLAPLCTLPSVPSIHLRLQCGHRCFVPNAFFMDEELAIRVSGKHGKRREENLSLYLQETQRSFTPRGDLLLDAISHMVSSAETACSSLNLGCTLLPMYQASMGRWGALEFGESKRPPTTLST